MAKALERLTITRAANDFLLIIEDDSGDTIELTATYDQLDLVTEELDRALDNDDLALIGDEDDDDRKPEE